MTIGRHSHPFALAALLGSIALAVSPAVAQQTTTADEAGTVIALLDLADTEYADAVRGGEIVNAAEYEEATEFTAEARRRLEALPAPARESAEMAQAAASHIVALQDAIEARVEPGEFARLTELASSAVAAGWDAVRIRFADRPSSSRGRVIYEVHCSSCHGATGAGDGAAGAELLPPPADLTAGVRSSEASLRRDFEVTSFGVPATAMAGWSDRLSLQDRWDVAAYLQRLRSEPGAEDRGRRLALRTGQPLAGHVRVLSDLEMSLVWSDEDLAGRVRAIEPAMNEAQVADVVAYLRAQTGASLDGVPEADRAALLAGRFAEIDSLLSDAMAAVRSGDGGDGTADALAAYMVFESLEPDIGARSASLLSDVEAAFGDFRADLATPDAVPDPAPLRRALDAAAASLTSRASSWSLAAQSFVIILREGFEAILIVGAIMAFLVKTGHPEKRKVVRHGVLWALVASLGVGLILRAVFEAVPARREVLEGVTMLLAVAVLFSVSYWLVSKLQHGRWDRYLRDKMQRALGTGSGLALALVAFLAVFREGVETVLFYHALGTLSDGNVYPVVLGFVVGTVALAAIYFAFTRFGVRIPMRPFFALTSGLLYAMAIVFAGAGIAELQEAAVVGFTPVPGVPQIPALGLYATRETLLAQGLLVALLVVALTYTFGFPRLQRSAEAAAAS